MAPRSVPYGKTASMDIPKPRDGPARRQGHAMLPTPPSSISPCLNPQGFKHRVTHEALHQYNLRSPPTSTPLGPHADNEIDAVDSDIDLQDTEDRRTPASAAASTTGKGKADVSGDITPAMLARHHLPDILLAHGPLAIRHIMGYLTTSVPGFAIIPAAKARRLVVAGLEGKAILSGGNNGESVDGDVEFEKVGWGRWDAYRRGQKDAARAGHAVVNHHHDTGSHPHYGSSVTADSAIFSHSDFNHNHDMDVDEADKMSLDDRDDGGRMYCSSSDAEDADIMDGDWDEADMTDEEDWANIGADALRAQSLGQELSMPSSVYVCGGAYGYGHGYGYGGGPSSSALAKAAPMPMPGVGENVEERAAVEALLQLGSM
ncbi:mucin [Arthroderma uncinatum]|uniref:mucin n=1 Tax=Arthroderma uncinatum TaxID=74035 RepID=UPI00144A931C|nr:mucin [Arthroderma uncinatum]KAF3491632.1 mucin [Arthroderma uncinatum]